MKSNKWTSSITTKAEFTPICKRQKFYYEKLIRVPDAITTTWMILDGLGRSKASGN